MLQLRTALLLLALCTPVLAQQAMTNDGIIKLVKAGMSDDLILTTIKAAPANYDTSANALIALKSAGVSEKVISAMLVKSSAAKPVPPSAENTGTEAAPTASTPPASDELGSAAPVAASTRILPGSRIVIAPMGGFETYFAAAVREKHVPVTLTLDKASAQYFVVSSNTEWQGFVYGSGGSASWNKAGGGAAFGSAGSATRGLEASIMLINAKTKDVVWAYEVHKNSHGALIFGTFGARGQQSVAEACAKHLKEFIEKGD